jgi:hypothetical protein
MLMGSAYERAACFRRQILAKAAELRGLKAEYDSAAGEACTELMDILGGLPLPKTSPESKPGPVGSIVDPVGKTIA